MAKKKTKYRIPPSSQELFQKEEISPLPILRAKTSFDHMNVFSNPT